MELLLLSLILIFLKTNLYFFDFGVVANVSSFIGSFLLIFSVYKLKHVSKHFLKMKTPTIILIFVNTITMLLNLKGAHINTFSRVIPREQIIGFTLISLALIGFVLTIYIAYRVICAMKETMGDKKLTVKILDRTWEFIIFTFIIVMFIPLEFLMLIHLLSIGAFLVILYVVMNEGRETFDIRSKI